MEDGDWRLEDGDWRLERLEVGGAKYLILKTISPSRLLVGGAGQSREDEAPLVCPGGVLRSNQKVTKYDYYEYDQPLPTVIPLWLAETTEIPPAK